MWVKQCHFYIFYHDWEWFILASLYHQPKNGITFAVNSSAWLWDPGNDDVIFTTHIYGDDWGIVYYRFTHIIYIYI